MEIKKILVPVDFSPCSINALKIAAGLAKGQGAELLIMNAIHVPAHPHADVVAAGSFVGSILSDYEDKVEVQLENLATEIPALSKIRFTTKKMVSITTDAIRDCLKNEDVDLVVMGTKASHEGLEKLIGSMSSEVIRFSKVPVLVIPENVESLKIENIGFAADLRKIENIEKLEFLKYIAKVSGAEIKIFHIYQYDDQENLAELGKERMKLLDFLSEVKHSYVWVAETEIMEGIRDFIYSHNLDMLSMYPRHHGFWDRLFHPSITKKIANNTRIPLLTFHE